MPTNYAAMIEAMGAGNAHIGWLAPVQYIVAHGKGYADVGFATVRNGSNHYGFQYVANAALLVLHYYDPATGKDRGCRHRFGSVRRQETLLDRPAVFFRLHSAFWSLESQQLKSRLAHGFRATRPSSSLSISARRVRSAISAPPSSMPARMLSDFPDVNDKV